jgi:cobalt/nickel transport system permease protein
MERNTAPQTLNCMHLPDGFLDLKTSLLAATGAAAGVALSVRRIRESVPPRRMPMLGLSAAFIFAAQMLNFPVAAGTSGHLMGGVLAAVLLGPSAAILVITSVLVVQCLLFMDGGLLALGANIFNMAIVDVTAGYLTFRLVSRGGGEGSPRITVFAAAFAGWVGTVAASVACAGQLGFAGTASWRVVLPAMAGVHMLIGLGEGLATGLVVLAVLRTRPALIASIGPESETPRGSAFRYGLIAAVGLAVFLAPFASPWPDGLERVAAKIGFEHKAEESPIPPAMPDYHLPAIKSATLGTALAGTIGTLAALGCAYLVSRAVVPKANDSSPQPEARRGENCDSKSGSGARP